jgi:hypothetical protein
MRWFEANSIVPFVVTYEDVVADQTRVVRSIVELLGAKDDEPEEVRHLPELDEQSDGRGTTWAARFEREIERGIQPPRSTHVFDRYAIAGIMAGPGPRNEGAPSPKRLRHRYEAIIASNRALFENARVLEIRSGVGRWCLAALDAGAAHVLGLEPRRRLVEAARNALIEDGVKPDSYQFIDNLGIFAALATLRPDAFDVALCTNFSGLADPYLCFNHLKRLQLKHVILDTDIIDDEEGVAPFELRRLEEAASNAARRPPGFVAAVLSHELIRLLCDHFGFRLRPIDWHALGIADWTGVRDYERGRRRTYVLDRIP